jgi:hypothetical protein
VSLQKGNDGGHTQEKRKTRIQESFTEKHYLFLRVSFYFCRFFAARWRAFIRPKECLHYAPLFGGYVAMQLDIYA